MALNFGILQPVNIGGQIMAGEQEAQRNQLAQQQLKTGAMQQEKAQMEMTGFKRRQAGLDEFLRLSAANGKTGTPEELADSFYNFSLTQGDPALVMSAYNARQAAKERSAYQASRTPGALAAPAIAPTPELPGVTVGGPNPPTVLGAAPMPTANRLALAPTPAASVNRLGVDTNALQTRIDELRSMYPNVPQAQKEADRLEKQLDRLNTTSPDAMLMQQLGYPLTQAGYQAFREAQRTERPDRLLTPAEEAQKMRLAVAGRAPAQPRAEAAPSITTIIDPTDSSKMITVDARRYQGGGVGSPGVIGVGGKEPSAGGVKQLTEAQTIKLRTDVGKDYQNASTALSQIDDLLASATSVKTAPGLSAATGFTGKLPSFSEGAAAQAETRLANLRGKVTALGKATASMGGAIGSIANQEWKILSDQIAVLDEVKGKGPLLEQIALLEEQAKGASERIRDKYEKTRAEDFERFPQFRDLPAPKTPAASGKTTAAQGTGGFKYLGKEGSK